MPTTTLGVQAHYRRGVSLMELHRYREAVEALQEAEALDANRDIACQLRLAREYLARVRTHTHPAQARLGSPLASVGGRRSSAAESRMNAIVRAYLSRRSRSRLATCPPRAEHSSLHGTSQLSVVSSVSWLTYHRPTATGRFGPET